MTKDQILLSEALLDAVKHATLPDLKAIVCEIFKELGGPNELAKIIVADFHASGPGSNIRARILEMILAGCKTLTIKEAPKDVNLISDDDLERELQVALSKVPKTGHFSIKDTQ